MYSIRYWLDLAMTRPASDADQITDIALQRYPAPTGDEVALAVHSDDTRLTRWGYDGAWRDTPPQASVEADVRERQRSDARQARQEYDAQPHVLGVHAHDAELMLVRLPDGSRQSITMTELRRAAEQSDPEGRAVYSALLAEAEAL